MITVRNSGLFLLALIFSYTNAYAQFYDNFSDGDFTSNPSWLSSNVSGTGGDFQVVNGELQSDGPAASATIWLSTTNNVDVTAGITTWTFLARYNNAPSGSNNLRIYLMSDQSDLTATTQGYYLQLGESGSGDGIDLYKTSSATPVITDLNASISSGIDVGIQVIRTAAGEWTLKADVNGGSNYSLIGTGTDTEFITGNNFGFLVNHTSTRNQSFYFDDVAISSTAGPPQISSISIISETQIDVSFSESLDLATAQNEVNYNIDQNVGAPSSAVLDNTNDRIVHLVFGSPLVNATTYQITVNQVEDLYGDAITTATDSFYFFVKQPAAFKDLIINEIYADPSESNGLPAEEFVELYNASNETYDLENWSFADAASNTTLGHFYLNPGEYVILCPSSSATSYENYGSVISLTSWPTLNNGGDALVLYDDFGNLIDSVDYDSDWYKDSQKSSGGWSLELIDPGNWCGAASNWSASIATIGGTPGEVNSIYNDQFDQQGPQLKQILVENSNIVKVVFDEPIDTTLVGASNFSVDQGIGVNEALLVNKDTIQLNLTPSLAPNQIYTLVTSGVSDCSGNVLSSQSSELIFVKGQQPEAKDIVINEIYADPSPPNDLPEIEFVELYNKSDKVFDLKDWTFSDQRTSAVFNYLPLFPGEYLILTSTEGLSAFESFGKTAAFNSWPSLNNGGDALVLKDSTGVIVDSIYYNDNWYKSSTKKEGGWSLELIDPNNECGEEDNWIASEDLAGGTPGQQNSVFGQNPDLTGPKLIEAIASNPDSILLIFDESLDPESLPSTTFTIEPDCGNLKAALKPNLKAIQLKLTTELQPGTEYLITINNLLDCSGNKISTDYNLITFGLLEQADSADLIINEILFNPRAGGEDFVEIYNKSDKYINLSQWQVANADMKEDSLVIQTKRTISEGILVLEPHKYLVLTSGNLALKDQYPLAHEDRFYELSSLPSYPNEEGIMALLNPDGHVFEYFNYSEDLHSSLLDNVDGISLERVSFTAPTNQKDNWKSAVASVGFATPGYENSSSRPILDTNNGEIKINPKVIIPDGSGQQDFTTINYSFVQSGNVATVTILDMQGRQIKEVVHNSFLGQTGFFTWDGTNENGRKARMGYYIILFEIFKPDGSTQILKDKVVIGNRF